MYLSKKLITKFFPEFSSIPEKKFLRILNSLGIELESIFEFKKTNNLVVGEILEIKNHENANKLKVCKVKVNKTKINTIVCGAKNILVGQKVIVALDGCKLFNDLLIKNREIRGIFSEGMICAYNELTPRNELMNEMEKDDIIALPSISIVGDKNPLKIINLDDKIYELSIPSNRNELNSIFGIIFELQSFLEIKKNLNFENIIQCQKTKLKLKNNVSKNHFLIEIENQDYNHSNWITKSYLMNSQISPSNNIEDLAKINQILTGVPSLVFTNIKPDQLEIIKLEKNTYVELNKYGKVLLEKGDIVLKNQNEIIALMNVDVVKKYAVDKDSQKVYFLSCLFNPLDIRKTFNRLKINNDFTKLTNKEVSSWWYEKSLDVFIRNLLPKFNPIKINFKFQENKQNKILIDFEKINNLLGLNIEKNKIINILKAFDYEIIGNFVKSPIYRIDVENDHDIIEDVLKIEGIENIVENKVSNSTINLNFNNENNLIDKIINLLINRGFFLVKNYNLTSKKSLENFNYFNYKNPIKIKNPISIDRECMRFSLLENILNCYSYNESFKNELLPIFEIQDIYFENGFKKHLILAVPDDIKINNFNKSKIESDIFILKIIIDSIASIFNKKFKYEKEVNEEWSCKNDSLKIFWNSEKIGYISRVNLLELKKFKIRNEKIYIAEIDITNLFTKNNETKFIDNIENKHKIIRELSIMLPKSYDLNKFYEISNKNNLIKNLEIINVFEKDNELSYSVKFELISNEKEIKENFNKVIDFYQKNNFKINQ